MFRLATTLVFVVIIVIGGCQNQHDAATNGNTLLAEIRKENDKHEKTFRQGDAVGKADLYTEDGMMLPPGSDFVKGRQAIAAFWQAGMESGLTDLDLEIVEVERHDDTAIEVGEFMLRGEGNQVVDQGKYIAIWKHVEDGSWKIHRGIFNSSLPPEGP